MQKYKNNFHSYQSSDEALSKIIHRRLTLAQKMCCFVDIKKVRGEKTKKDSVVEKNKIKRY